MKITVINGSPKGRNSITLQTVLYLEQCFPEHTFSYHAVGQQIRSIAKDPDKVLASMQEADLILFSYPVYTFIAPCQLHRFMELVKDSGIDLSGKFVSQITTSKHFYDVTAHRYIQDNVQDLGMKYIRGLSADMDDLLHEKGQTEARKFFRYILWCMKQDHYEELPQPAPAFVPIAVHIPAPAPKHSKKDVVIITDCRPEDQQRQPFSGGCLGCFHCAVTGKCIYKDKFDDFLRNDIQTADAIVYAFTIQDHSMGAAMKQYDDRQFCNGHRTVTSGMSVGYLISGAYSREENLRMIVEGRAEVGGNFLAGVATDEVNPDQAIDKLARTLSYSIQTHYTQPANFLGVGGMKIFRDLIFLMQGMMKADHAFYKKHGHYDFPHQQPGTILKMYLVGALISNPKVQSKMGSMMTEGMLMPYKKVLEQKTGK